MFPENNWPFVTGVACRTPAEYKCNGARTLIILSETALPCPPCLGVCAFSGLQDPTCYSCLPDWHPLAHTKLFRLDEELFLFGLSCQVYDWVAGDCYLVKLGSRELGDELLLADDVEGRAWGEHLRVGLVQDQHLRVPERWRKQQLHAVHNHRLLGRRPNHLHRLPCGNSRSDFPLMH